MAQKETQGNEPDKTAKADGTAKLENAKQDTVDARNEAVESGHEAARENAEAEREDQPAPEGE